MIDVNIEFAIYFYVLTSACLVGVLWFLWHSKRIADWRDFAGKGRQPHWTCENCLSSYVDSRSGAFSTCPACRHLNKRE